MFTNLISLKKGVINIEERKQCSICGEYKTLVEFTVRSVVDGKINYRSECKDCMKKYDAVRHQEKKKFIDSKKDFCRKCGETRKYVLDFHHIDSSKKSFTISSKTNYSLEKIENEINKCVLLCSNCHREFHHMAQNYNLTLEDYIGADIENMELISQDELDEIEEKIKGHRMSMMTKHSYLSAILNGNLDEVLQEETDEMNLIYERLGLASYGICCDCGKEISKSAKRCEECSHIAGRKVIRPTKDELQSLINQKSFVEIGKMYDVSDNTVRKWCKNYGLPHKRSMIRKSN